MLETYLKENVFQSNKEKEIIEKIFIDNNKDINKSQIEISLYTIGLQDWNTKSSIGESTCIVDHRIIKIK